MDFVIRPARVDDVPLISDWTRNTFTWGDYVTEVLPAWLEDPGSLVIVCVDHEDSPMALSRVQMLSPTEAWLSAARVHPSHRRSGMGSAMNRHCVDWARERGARVARLAIEESNVAAVNQVVKSGYHTTGHWAHVSHQVAPGPSPDPGAVLRPALPIDADAAWTFWSRSDLALLGRELIADGWRWRKATRADLEAAVESRTFFQGSSGWLIATPDDGSLFVGWLATAVPDAPLLIQGMIGLARQSGLDEVDAMVPAAPWLVEALTREGFDIQPMLIFSLPL